MRDRSPATPYAWLPALIVSVIVLTAVAGGFALLHVERSMVTLAGQSLSVTASNIADEVDRLLYERYADVQLLAQAPLFHSQDIEGMDKHLRRLRETYPVYLRLDVTDATGRTIASSQPDRHDLDQSRASWFQAVSATRKVHISDTPRPSGPDSTQGIQFSAPVLTTTGELRRVLTAFVGLPVLEDIFQSATRAFEASPQLPGRLEWQFLLRDGTVVADSILHQEGQVNLRTMQLPSALKVITGKPGYVEEQHLRRHVPVITGYAQTRGHLGLPNLHWAVLVRMDSDEVIAPIRAALWKLAAAAMLVLLPMVGLLFWSTSRLRHEHRDLEREVLARQRATSMASSIDERLRTLVENIPGTVYRCKGDRDWTMEYLSDRVFELCGYPASDFIGRGARSFASVIHPDDRECVERTVLDAVKRRAPYQLGYRILHADGRTRWVHERGQAVFGERGQVLWLDGAIFDNTERQAAEERLRQSEGRYRALYDENPSMFFTLDAEGTILSVNTFGASQLGYSVPELIGQPVTRVFAPEDQEAVRAQLADCLTHPHQVARWEFRKVRKDGSRLWVRESVRVTQDPSGQLVCLVTCQDVSDRKRMEELVLDQQRFLASIVENLPDMVFVKHAKDLRFVQFNRAGEQLLGYPRAALIGKNDYDFFPKEEAEFFTRKDREVLASGTLLDIPEEPIQTADGIRFLHTKKIPILDEDGSPRYLLGISEDITDRRLREQAERTRARLVEEHQTALLSLIKHDAIHGGDLMRAFPLITESAARFNHAARASLWFLNEPGTSLELADLYDVSTGRHSAGTILDAADRPSYFAALTAAEEPLLVSDVRTDARTRELLEGNPCAPEVGAMLDAPIRVRGRVCGVLCLEHPAGPRVWTPEEVNFAGSLATLISLTLETAERTRAEEALRTAQQDLERRVQERTTELDAANQALQKEIAIRREAETSLRESQDRLARTEAFSLVMVTHVGLDGRWLRVPDRLCALVGYSQAELLAGKFQDITHPDDVEADWSQCQQLIRGEIKSFELEKRYIRKDGTIVWVYLNCSGVYDQTGQLVHFLTYIRDISSLKQAELSLRESERRWRELLEAVPIGIAFSTSDGRVLEVNTAGWKMLGYASKADFLATPASAHYVNPADRQRRLELASRGIMDFEAQYRRKDGSLFWGHAVATTYQADNGEVLFINAYEDVTERKQAEHALRESEARLRLLVENSEVVPWEADPVTYQFTYVGPHARSLLGYPIERWHEPRFWEAHLHPEDRAAALEFCHAQSLTSDHYDFEYRMLTADGSVRWVHDLVSVMREGDQVTALRGFFVDITARKQMEATRHQLLEKVIAAQEEERRRIARELHDQAGQSLTSLLVGLRSLTAARTLAEARPQAEALRQVAATALAEVERISRGLRPSVLDDLGLEAAIERLAREFTTTHGVPVKLDTAGLGKIRCPASVETTLYRIVQEALTNIARHADAAHVWILLHCYNDNDSESVQAIIEDNGCGFDVDAVWRADGDSQSLGLHGMRERARLLNGSLTIESKPGEGTAVCVTLPIPERTYV